MGHSGESFHALLGAAAAVRGLLLAGMGAGLLTASCEPEREFVCEGAQSLPGGFARCNSGAVHRAQAGQCAGPAVPFPLSDRPGGVMRRDCSTDSDCDLLPGGFCQQFTDPFGGAFVHCVYPCMTDEDCGQGFACFCGSQGGECIPAECTTGADCGGSACVTLYTTFECHPTLPRLACWTKELECDSTYCGNSSDACIEGACVKAWVCGRPFLIDSVERRADVVSRDGWCPETFAGDVDALAELDPALRAVLSDHWSRCAAMEHASIAAFARFALQLLSLGAPADLVERTARALADETEHAKICFALASRYAGEQLGPAVLAIDGCLESLDLHALVETAFVEACIGETTAALEAFEAARQARDPRVQQALLRIARDEASHAELGFAFMTWIFGARPELREELAIPCAVAWPMKESSSKAQARRCPTIANAWTCPTMASCLPRPPPGSANSPYRLSSNPASNAC